MTTDPSREEYGQIDLITSEETVQELLLVHSEPGKHIIIESFDDKLLNKLFLLLIWVLIYVSFSSVKIVVIL